ncbi:MAG: iron-sulfur cluster assembly accessory protein [Holosporaceae bacterium]|jgi:iron-sulfur cluster assembly protein|nr:iron-sulfur cluster assembly accessory protein [Holosporaceae bacterium]
MEKIINVTDDAINFIKKAVEEEEGSIGLRVSIASGGCQGMVYQLALVKESDPSDLVVQENGVNVYIESEAVIFISGMTMDYVKTPLSCGLVFENPNAKSKCGCGKSFCTDERSNCRGTCSSCL